MTDSKTPIYRLQTARLVIRCWEPTDAALLKDAIDANLEHLRPWMPWAHDEPSPLGEVVDRLRYFRSSFDRDEDYIYGIFDPDETRVLGGTGLHPRVGDGAREVGYWMREDATGEGLATEAAGAVTRVGFEALNLDRIEIRCGPTNLASARVAEKLGYTHECTLPKRMRQPDGSLRDTMLWSLFARDYPESVAHAIDVYAHDAVGNELHL
ncbi:MAG: GNAT family N-acetyltransferase [Myxococcota bacterium]